jgi:pimeloyl-ACP methyl ester carboxylesterase
MIDARSRVGAALAAHRTLLLVDGPGHGSSGPPAGRFTLDDCATAAARVLDERDISGPVDWLGNAWGGHVGLVFAATRPTRTQTVTAIAAPVRPLGGIERARIIAQLTAYRLAGPVRPLPDLPQSEGT